ncbi:TPA: Lrp/AsnC family transcriptional regulator [Candidatus Bathyarchaeota archaeon]|nr:Lrp/AsnC family transcriptional regulator [Candidatus Bathyarchaeota archaeon]
MVRISNLELIKTLEENARKPFVKIARKFNVSETAVRKRIKKLEKEGVIKGYTVEVDYGKLGFSVNALIGVDTSPEHYLLVIEKLKLMKEIKALYSSTGDHMLLIRCVFKTSGELGNFIKKVKEIEGVTRVCPAILLEKLK